MGATTRVLWQIPEIVLGTLVIAIAVLINLQIVMRYFLNQPVGWSDEISRVLMVWVTFLGGAVAVGRGTHLGLHILGRRLSPAQLRTLNVVVFVGIILFASVVLVTGIEATRTAFRQTLTMTDIPVGWMYLACPVGAGLTIIYALRAMIQRREPIPSEVHAEDRPAEQAL